MLDCASKPRQMRHPPHHSHPCRQRPRFKQLRPRAVGVAQHHLDNPKGSAIAEVNMSSSYQRKKKATLRNSQRNMVTTSAIPLPGEQGQREKALPLKSSQSRLLHRESVDIEYERELRQPNLLIPPMRRTPRVRTMRMKKLIS